LLSKETMLELGDQYFPHQPPKPAYVGSCESEMYLLSAKQQHYPTKKDDQAGGEPGDGQGRDPVRQGASS